MTFPSSKLPDDTGSSTVADVLLKIITMKSSVVKFGPENGLKFHDIDKNFYTIFSWKVEKK